MELSSISIAITSLVGALFSPGAMFTTGVNGAWYDPSDLTTLFQDAAGTTPVTAVGQPVGRILDKSGRGNHAYNPSGNSANFPVLQQDGTGRYYLAFNGTNQWLQTNSIDFTYGDKMFVAAGHRNIGMTGSALFIESSVNAIANAGAFALAQGPTTSNTGWGFLGNNGSGAGAQTAPQTLPYTAVSSLTIDPSKSGVTNEGTLRMNGVAQTFVSTVGLDLGTGNYGNYPMYIGARAGTSLWFNGRLYGLVVAGKAASASEITNTETFINQRTGAY